MSVSSFHEHFKSVTSMSPLHDQKVLRLQDARRLMLSTMTDAGTASQRGRLSQCFPVQPGIQPLLRECSNQGHRQVASRDWSLGLTVRSGWGNALTDLLGECYSDFSPTTAGRPRTICLLT
jgi:AraC-like DNA-binding protein